MKTTTLSLSVVFVLILLSFFCSFAEERITLTTYYPAPYGVYIELRADKISVGSGYRNTALSDGTFIASGNVGIGTANPSAKLEVNGNAKINGNLTVDGDIDINANAWSNCTWTGWLVVGRGAGVYPALLCPASKYQAGMQFIKNRDGDGDYDWHSFRLYCCEI